MNRSLATELIEAPARARELFPRGGFEGLDPAALQVLAALSAKTPATAEDLGALLVLDPSTVRHSLSLLRRKGLALESADEADRRRHPHAITDEGRQAFSEFVASVRRRLREDGSQ